MCEFQGIAALFGTAINNNEKLLYRTTTWRFYLNIKHEIILLDLNSAAMTCYYNDSQLPDTNLASHLSILSAV